MKLKKAKENKNYRTSKGITLIPLIITVVLMMVLVGVVITNGLHSADNAQLQNFFRELQIIQKRVDVIYQEAKTGNNAYIKYNAETDQFTSEGIGTALTSEMPNGVSDNEGYYYYTPIDIENLGIEGMTQKVYINWKTRDVVSVDGIEVNDIHYYRYEGENKPDYIEAEAKDITITTVAETNGDIKTLTVTEVKTTDGVEVTDYTLKYKLDGETVWKIADYNYFKTVNAGEYYIQVSGNGINSKEEIVLLQDVPEEYIQVEYIESTGTQYIDTGYYGNLKTNIEIEATLIDVSSSGNYAQLLGDITNTSKSISLNIPTYINDDTINTNCRFGDVVYSFKYSKGFKFNVKHNIKLNKDELKIDNVTYNSIGATTEFITSKTLYLGATNNSKAIGSWKIYKTKIYDNDTLVRDFIPCYSVSDTEIGMYDLVTGTFYGNEGTGNFKMGDEI